MEISGSALVRMRALALPLASIFTLSFLAQIVQIGTIPAVVALKLQAQGAAADVVGIVAAGPWVAILVAGRLVPRLLNRFGVVACITGALSASIVAVFGMSMLSQPLGLFCLNLLFGVGLILRWVACDTWIVAVAPGDLRGRIIGAHETLMGCGIAAGPIILSVSGASSNMAFSICLALLATSAALLFAARRHDISPESEHEKTRFVALRKIPVAILAGGLAGLVETSSITFLPVMANQAIFLLGAVAALFGFGIGGTVLQVPLGWLADRAGYRRAQLMTAFVVLAGAVGIVLFARATPVLIIVLFFWGGAAGGMNTLAVIEAGNRMQQRDISTAMTSIAMAYTVGSIVGPIATGMVESHVPGYGLTMAAATSAAIFLTIRACRDRKGPSHT
jgi:MFS family permease